VQDRVVFQKNLEKIILSHTKLNKWSQKIKLHINKFFFFFEKESQLYLVCVYIKKKNLFSLNHDVTKEQEHVQQCLLGILRRKTYFIYPLFVSTLIFYEKLIIFQTIFS